jgi:hypothetical protein
MMVTIRRWLPAVAVFSIACTVHAGAAHDEFKVKRAGPFASARNLTVTRDGDRVTISFTTKAYCDVTVAIEGPPRGDRSPVIIRHLACGVLGGNAPPPFRKSSLEQTLVWDGKDDAGDYVDNKHARTVCVSLGLKPRFERTLFWSPGKPTAGHTPIICPRPEGVYVYQGGVLDHLRLFDHDGNYIRTVYPFPANQVAEVKGLRRHRFPHDGDVLPLKGGFHQATLLTCGSNYQIGKHTDDGVAGTTLAIHGRTVAIIHNELNAVACDSQGRVYVSDYRNDRIQVFSPDKKLLKTIRVDRPAEVAVHQRNGHLYVFSWWYRSQFYREGQFHAKLTHLGPFEKPVKIASYPLPRIGRQKPSG